jgi:REP element-mobilizing transposase RayT
LIQSVPTNSVEKIIKIIKSITAKELFNRFAEIKQKLWGGNFWTSGYYANTVGQYANEDGIRKYFENQGNPKEKYKKIYSNQLILF